MKCVVVDTNVFAVVAGQHPGASEACQLACIDLLRDLHAGLPIAVDTDGRIFEEYLARLRGTSRSGLATKLANHLSRTRYGNPACHQVPLTPLTGPRRFEEVPEVLGDFDTDDQVFIAVAAVEPCAPQIYTAVDGEWWERRSDFSAAGLDVQFCCAADLRRRTRATIA